MRIGGGRASGSFTAIAVLGIEVAFPANLQDRWEDEYFFRFVYVRSWE